MTWTLRVYDTDGNEIGWLTEDPYEYEITGPHNASSKAELGVKATFAEYEDRVEEDHPPDFTGGSIAFISIESEGEEFLNYVKEQIEGRVPEEPLGSITVADE